MKKPKPARLHCGATVDLSYDDISGLYDFTIKNACTDGITVSRRRNGLKNGRFTVQSRKDLVELQNLIRRTLDRG